MPAITVSHLDKWYGSTHALRDVSLACGRGEVHAIAGENGAGKSTLMKILSGVVGAASYTGQVEVGGALARFNGIRDAERAGIFIVPQELQIVPQLSISEYLFLNREPTRWGLVNHARLWRDTQYWLSAFQLSESPLTPMGELTSHAQQIVSIARAMTRGVQVLILDEPTASLTDREAELLFGRVKELRSHGVTTLFISHRLSEIERIADAVTVMRDGAVVDNFRSSEERAAPARIVTAMVGRSLEELYPKRPAPLGERVLELKNWTAFSAVEGRPPPVKDVDLDVRAGEVLGIFGLIGSGASELARSIFGAHHPGTAGELRIRGQKRRLRSARDAVRSGIAYMPSDRKRDGMVLGMSVGSNLSLVELSHLARWGIINRAKELREIHRYISGLQVKCASVDQPVSGLSGGNQQKVVAAKWLLTEPDLFVMEEPTRGVDVGARIQLYEMINDVARRGKAVIIISTDLPEVLGMSDRVLVIRGGRIVAESLGGEMSGEDVMLHATGAMGRANG